MKKYSYSDKAFVGTDAFLSASEEELRTLCVLLTAKEPLCAEDVFAAAGLATLGDAKDALAFWRGAGIIRAVNVKKAEGEKTVSISSGDEKTAQTVSTESAETPSDKKKRTPCRAQDALPTYSGKELALLIEKENLASFIEACQQIYGKVLSSTDINILLGIHKELGVDCEYICLLLAFYAEKAKKPMRYVEKVAFSLYDLGILTVSQLEEYIEKKKRMYTREQALRKLFGIGERALSSKEEETFVRWCEVYAYDDAMISLAFDMTVGATGKASVAYTDKIISHWNTAGCKTVKDVLDLLAKEKSEKAVKKSTVTAKSAKQTEKDAMRSFEVDDLFARALDRSYGTKK